MGYAIIGDYWNTFFFLFREIFFYFLPHGTMQAKETTTTKPTTAETAYPKLSIFEKRMGMAMRHLYLKLSGVGWQLFGPYNTITLSNQTAPYGTYGTYKQRQDEGRQVKKGEKAYRLLFPINGKEDEDTITFRLAPFFHLDQTDPCTLASS